jgi:hypothetical protein
MNASPEPKDFGLVLKEQRRGRLVSELSYLLAELTRQVYHHGKPGSLQLTLKISPTKENIADHVLLVTDEVKFNAPKPDQISQFFYADMDGNLSLSNPDQGVIPGIREVHDEDQGAA